MPLSWGDHCLSAGPRENRNCIVLDAVWLALTRSYERYPSVLALIGAVSVGERIVDAVGGWSSRDC